MSDATTTQLERAGLTKDQAMAIATQFGSVATKADIQDLHRAIEGVRTDLRLEIEKTRVEIAGVAGRVSQLPTILQVITAYIGVAIGLAGLVFAVARTVGTP